MSIKTINTPSIKKRFIASLILNVVRVILNFISVLILAKSLAPAGYGNLMFLLGSFLAIRSLLDLGSSNAFFTLISQNKQGRNFYLFYLVVLLTQFILMALFIIVLCPQTVIERLWVGHSKYLIMLAFTVSFLQQQIWKTIGQIGEAERQTVKVQLLNVAVACVNLVGIYILIGSQWCGIDSIMIFYSSEYIVFTLVGIWWLKIRKHITKVTDDVEISFKEIMSKYIEYCRPLVFLMVLAVIYDFLDKWMLQQFGGASQQGYYQIANQIAAISLVATTSILNVFWREIADAYSRDDKKQIAYLYQRATRGLVMFGSAIAGFLIPWTAQIIVVFLGDAYLSAVPVLAMMFLYPIHQAVGQINGAVFLACSRTNLYTSLGTITMCVSIPVSYIIQAPAEGIFLPGLNLGATGMAIKMVMLNILGVNYSTWMIARWQGWRFDWQHQIVAVLVCCMIGYIAHGAVVSEVSLLTLGMTPYWQFASFLVAAAILYIPGVVGSLIMFPWLIGMNRQEIRLVLEGARKGFRRNK